MDVIEAIEREFPDLNIVHLYKVFEEKPTIGQVRKYLVDAVLLRKMESDIEKSIAIVSNDADLEDISEDYVDRISGVFKKNKKMDAIEGRWDYPAETFKKYPLLHASQRLWRYLDIAFRNYGLKTQDLAGTNSVFRSGIYAAVGGYNQEALLAEDWEIGQLIKEPVVTIKASGESIRHGLFQIRVAPSRKCYQTIDLLSNMKIFMRTRM